jgi:hypothetical protein
MNLTEGIPMSESKYEKLFDLVPEELKRGLLPPEDALLHRAIDGEPLDRRSPNKVENDPKNADRWGKERTIRADFLRWICINEDASPLVHARGFEIYGIKLQEPLNLDSATVPHRLGLFECSITGITLQDANTKSINLSGSHTGPIIADRLTIDGSIFFA